METIEWKQLERFPKYEISTIGQIRRIGVNEPRKTVYNERAGGYEQIMLWDERGRPTNQYVHRLMVESFLGGFPEGTETRHRDGNPRNNRLENLAVGTKVENAADRYIHGTIGRKHIPKSFIQRIRDLWVMGETASNIKRMLDLEHDAQAIAKAARGRTYRKYAR